VPPGTDGVGGGDPGEDHGGGQGGKQRRREDHRRRGGGQYQDPDHPVFGHPAEHHVLEERPSGEEQGRAAEDDGDPAGWMGPAGRVMTSSSPLAAGPEAPGRGERLRRPGLQIDPVVAAGAGHVKQVCQHGPAHPAAARGRGGVHGLDLRVFRVEPLDRPHAKQFPDHGRSVRDPCFSAEKRREPDVS